MSAAIQDRAPELMLANKSAGDCRAGWLGRLRTANLVSHPRRSRIIRRTGPSGKG